MYCEDSSQRGKIDNVKPLLKVPGFPDTTEYHARPCAFTQQRGSDGLRPHDGVFPGGWERSTLDTRDSIRRSCGPILERMGGLPPVTRHAVTTLRDLDYPF